MDTVRKLKAVAWPLATFLGAGVAATVLHLRDPHVSGSWGQCPIYFQLGVYCPGCGGLRAVNDLTNLDFPSALHSNLLVVLGALIFVFWSIVWFYRSLRAGRSSPPRISPYVLPGAIVAMLCFAILRNLEVGLLLRPGQ